MRRIIVTGSAMLLVIALSLVVALAKPDFSGTWVMDRSRSIGLPPGMNQTMTVVQTGDRLDIETKLITAQGERVVKDAYTLDGKEAEFTPQGPQGPNGKGKRKGAWLPRGNSIVVNEDTITQGQNGQQVNSQLTRKWILSPDGQTLTIDMYFDGPNGSFETKRIFIKKTN